MYIHGSECTATLISNSIETDLPYSFETLREGWNPLESPAKWLGLLEGITRNTILSLASDAGMPLEETTLTRFDLFTADRCFLTGSGAELILVTAIDGRVIGDEKRGPVTANLRVAFRKLVSVF